MALTLLRSLYDVNSIAFYVVKKVWIHVWMHVDNINWTLEKLLQITLQTNNHINIRSHLNADVYIAILMLFATGNRAEKTQ